MATGGKRRVPSGLSENQKKQARQESRVVTDEAIAALPPPSQIHTIYPASTRPLIFNAVQVPDNGIVQSADLRTVSPMTSDTKGVWVSLYSPVQSSTSDRRVFIDTSGVAEAHIAGSSFVVPINSSASQTFPVALGADGKVQLSTDSTANIDTITGYVTMYWT